jgi:hypothetical protein
MQFYLWPQNPLANLDINEILNRMGESGILTKVNNKTFKVIANGKTVAKISIKDLDWLYDGDDSPENEDLHDTVAKHFYQFGVDYKDGPYSTIRRAVIAQCVDEIRDRANWSSRGDFANKISMNGDVVWGPTNESVFSQDPEGHGRNLLPLAVIHDSVFGLNGNKHIPIVIPVEPLDGMIGDHKKEYYKGQCHYGWVGFNLDSGKCKLQTDLKFFFREGLRNVKSKAYDYQKEADEVFKNYAKWKKQAQKTYKYIYQGKPTEFIKTKGNALFHKYDSVPPESNIGFPKGFPANKRTRVPIDNNGNDFIFIGTLEMESISFWNGSINFYISCDESSLALSISHD